MKDGTTPGSVHASRYEFVTCPLCSRSIQRIDFGGNPHAYLCDSDRAWLLLSELENRVTTNAS